MLMFMHGINVDVGSSIFCYMGAGNETDYQRPSLRGAETPQREEAGV